LDVDVVADVQPEHAVAITKAFKEDFYVDERLIEESIVRGSSFNLIHFDTGLKVDVFVVGSREYDRVALSRRTPETPSFMMPEDVLLGKLEWFRTGDEVSDRQWHDILGIVRVQGDALDLEYARRWAHVLGVADLLERAVEEGRS
jgi:hypothetical protein